MKRILSVLQFSALALSCAQPAQVIVPVLSEVQQLELACEEGQGEACCDLGRLFLSNDAVSTRRAERAFESGCELKFGPACLELGELLQPQADTPFGDTNQRQERALSYYEQACEIGEKEGCQKVGHTLFFKAHKVSEQARGLLRLEHVCDDGHHAGCVDVLRVRLAQGSEPSSLLLSRLDVHCRLHKAESPSMDVFCARLRLELCRSDSSEPQCKGKEGQTAASILDNPSCPAEDVPWLLSVIHTHVQSCGEAQASQLQLHFDVQGQMSLGRTKVPSNSCLARRIHSMRILPLTTIRGCNLNVRF